jgi:arabinogalactan endo-1,4-beta-galactosidase
LKFLINPHYSDYVKKSLAAEKPTDWVIIEYQAKIKTIH